MVGVPNIFAKQQLELKYKPMIMELLEKNGASEIDVDLKYIQELLSLKKYKLQR